MMLDGGHYWSANVLVKGSPSLIRHVPECACIRLLIRRLWVRVPPPEPIDVVFGVTLVTPASFDA